MRWSTRVDRRPPGSGAVGTERKLAGPLNTLTIKPPERIRNLGEQEVNKEEGRADARPSFVGERRIVTISTKGTHRSPNHTQTGTVGK
jgi:hypothetical protein